MYVGKASPTKFGAVSTALEIRGSVSADHRIVLRERGAKVVGTTIDCTTTHRGYNEPEKSSDVCQY